MQNNRLWKSARLAGACLAMLTVYSGCEDDPSDDGINSYFDSNPYQTETRTTPQQPQPEEPAVTPAVELSISPASASVAQNQLINFVAVGGTAPFTWNVATLGIGTIAPQGNPRYAIYRHTGLATEANNVVVTDGAGASAIARIN